MAAPVGEGSTGEARATPLKSIPLAAWWVLALMTIDYALGMIDRNAVSVLKTTLKAEFGVGDSAYSLLVTAFMVPYAICYILCGRIVDRWGSRGPLTLFVLVWSGATIGAGLSRTFPELVAWRAVLGAAEAGLLPATLYALVNWFPRDRLATVYAIKNPLQTMGAILSPPLIAGLALAYGWRAGFIVPGITGIVFAVLWWFADRSPPQDRATLKAEAAVPRPGFTALIRNPLLWGVLLARLVSDPVWFFFQYWQAGYLQEQMGLSLADVGRILWIPPFLSVLLTFVTAAISDRLIARGWAPAKSRIRIMQATVILSPLIALIPFIDNVTIVMAIFATTYFMAFTWLAMSNILMADLFPKSQVGSAVGIISCVGTIGAAAFNAGVGTVIEGVGYVPVFSVLALVHPVALIIMWRFYSRRFD
ncbi:MFS transporter [Sphingomonas sp. SFZ2018-12]|uniref:MFS transporter n=1 Tax=Sphingomonas sp. SFZ2018-12 TaxID=2683197 RepID=UPI001F0F7E5B|nr:MFS transporter [Sphingomonas sp. SFZ2018-12]